MPPAFHPEPPARLLTRSVVPESEAQGYDMHRLIEGVVDADSFFEVKPLWAPELIVGFGRLEGHAIGVVANNPAAKGGVLFVDSADKAARFIWLCDAFNVPLLFLADVPGFMIGTQVEREGIIRHGAKMITAVTEATVPKISVIVRKAYGAGLYAMSGPAFDPIATIALPTAKIAVMGPEAAVNAVFANKIAAFEDPDERAAYVAERRQEYEADVDLLRLASELVIDAVVPFEGCATSSSAASPPPTPGTGSGWPSATGCHRYEADLRHDDPPLQARSPPIGGGFRASNETGAGLMPWCDDCSKYWNPSSMLPDGSCPTCGRVLPERMFAPQEDGGDADADDASGRSTGRRPQQGQPPGDGGGAAHAVALQAPHRPGGHLPDLADHPDDQLGRHLAGRRQRK